MTDEVVQIISTDGQGL